MKQEAPMVAASTSVGERIGILDARIAEQGRRVADIEAQARKVADAIAHMKPKQALAAAADQGKRREAIVRARQEAADKLVELQARGGQPRRRTRPGGRADRPGALPGGAARHRCGDHDQVVGRPAGAADRPVGRRIDGRGGAAELTRPESA
jgi:hypothetical protein